MNQDRIERQIAFIIDQQAKFVVDIAGLREGITELRESLAEMKDTQERANIETRENVGKLTDALLSLAGIVEKHDGQIATLIEEGIKTDERIRETDARLNTLISVMERHVSNHHGQ